MTDVASIQVPPPVDWQAFERLTLDLFETEWRTTDAQPHGRTGQPRNGVDVYGTDRRTNERVGVQCKGKNAEYGHALKEKELRDEVEKAKKFVPSIHRFILATTAPTDAKIQEVARELDVKHRKSGLFEVMVMGGTKSSASWGVIPTLPWSICQVYRRSPATG